MRSANFHISQHVQTFRGSQARDRPVSETRIGHIEHPSHRLERLRRAALQHQTLIPSLANRLESLGDLRFPDSRLSLIVPRPSARIGRVGAPCSRALARATSGSLPNDSARCCPPKRWFMRPSRPCGDKIMNGPIGKYHAKYHQFCSYLFEFCSRQLAQILR